MAQARGYQSQLVLDFETTFNEDPASAAGVLLPFNTCDIRSTRNKNSAQTITGTRNPVEPFDGNLAVSGNVTVPVDVRNFWYWLKLMFGAPTTTGTGPYAHEFTIGNTQPSAIIEKKIATATPSYMKNSGCKVSRFSMSVGGDGELTASIDVEGGNETISTTAYDGTATMQTFTRFQNFQASLIEGGSSLAIATEVSFDVDFGLDTENYCIGGNGIRHDLPEGIMAISGNLTALFEDMTLLNKAINSTESALVLTLTNGSHTLVINIPELQYQRNSPGIPGPQGILVELPFVGYFADDSNESAIIVTLTNDVETY